MAICCPKRVAEGEIHLLTRLAPRLGIAPASERCQWNHPRHSVARKLVTGGLSESMPRKHFVGSLRFPDRVGSYVSDAPCANKWLPFLSNRLEIGLRV